MTDDSFKKRYALKLLANLVGFGFNILSQAIIPRALGPVLFGSFGFLTNFFSQFVSFLDMGTSTCFYTKLSGRPKDLGLVRFYGSFALIAAAVTFLFVGLAGNSRLAAVMWPDQRLVYVYLAAAWALLMWWVSLLTLMGDAWGLTVPMEKARMLQRAFAVLLILLLFVLGRLRLTQLFLYHFVVLSLLAGCFVYVFEKTGHPVKDFLGVPARAEMSTYSREFYSYTHPLFLVSAFALLAGMFDRWILQIAGGSLQQGFYTLSYQIGAMCFLFTSAMTPLLLREFSIAHASDDPGQMAILFRRYCPLLFSIAAFFSGFVAIQAEKVVQIFGGGQYRGATAAVTIMAFYPIHQTYGQLTASVFYATGETSAYRNIGMVFLLVGLPLTYFLTAPADRMGLNAGATGLAWKMVLLNIVGVNVQLYYNAILLKLRFWRYVMHQILSIACLLGLAEAAKLAIDLSIGSRGYLIARFLAAGVLYSLLAAVVGYLLPDVFGINRADARLLRTKLKNALGYV